MIASKMRVMKGKTKTQALIILSGVENSGKSTALITLINILREKASFFYEECTTNKIRDRRAVIPFWKWKVAICTAGDDLGHVTNSLNFIRDMRCEIGIVAARPNLVAQCKKWAAQRKTQIGELKKPNMTTTLAQEMCAIRCAEIICDALSKCSVNGALKCINDAGQVFLKLGI